jgi:hypothetical protein
MNFLNKRIGLILIVLVLNIQFALAEKIDSISAGIVAKNFYLQQKSNGGINTLELKLTKSFLSAFQNSVSDSSVKTPLFYLYNINEGFVIVSADDRITPILGYSISGNYSGINLPPAFIKLLENYKKEIQFILVNNLSSDEEIKLQWDRLRKGESIHTQKNLASVDPLLTTTWNQSPYYNELCPYDYYYNEYTVTGCVATAMAQIMKYWNYPTQGTGFHSYDCPGYGTQTANFAATTYNWAAMPNNVSSSNDAVATLMYHCGVSVDMNYGVGSVGGSSAMTSDVVNALTSYFQFSNSAQYVQKTDYSNNDWIQLLKNELNTGRPMQYRGSGDAGGHSFVCDGYDNSDLFHFNWGWGGSANGYFTLTNLNPGTYNFTSLQAAIIGIQPASGGGVSNIDLYSSININPNPIDFYQSFVVNVDFVNSGSTNFSGDYCAALFSEDGTFIDYVSILSASSNPLPPGYHYTGGLTFSNTGMLTVPGNYIIGIYYMDAGGEWLLAGNATYTNPVITSINSPNNPLEQYSNIVVTPSTFVQGQSASVNVNLYNTNSYTYFGQYQAALYDLSGNFVQTIGIYDETSGLPSGYIYNSPYITFTTTSIIAPPGTYMLAILEKENGYADWYFVGGSYYLTPININVIEAPLSPDTYEPNNVVGAAYNLAVNFAGNTATQNTVGSNIHNDGDLDYYQINLETGYDYTITARIHDSYNSGNGQTYTCDVMFAYNYGSTWSDTYDDIMPSPIIITNGGTLLFSVSPYFAGETGTYLLDLTITRINAAPEPAGAINGPTSVCQGQANITYSVPPITNATTYIWTLPSGASGSSTTNAIVVSYSMDATSGNISVMGSNSSGNGVPSLIYINVSSIPPTPIITQNVNVLTSSSTGGNQWYNSAGIINGATSQQYHATTNGIYYTIVTINGCSSLPSNVINVVITNIDNIDIASEILIYPNPVKNELTIEASAVINIKNFEILNSLGQVIYKTNMLEKNVIQMSEFSCGVYIIRFNKANSFLFKKFVKQ